MERCDQVRSLLYALFLVDDTCGRNPSSKTRERAFLFFSAQLEAQLPARTEHSSPEALASVSLLQTERLLTAQEQALCVSHTGLARACFFLQWTHFVN